MWDMFDQQCVFGRVPSGSSFYCTENHVVILFCSRERLRRVLRKKHLRNNVSSTSSYLHLPRIYIFTYISAHLHIFTYLHVHIFPSAHLHLCSSSHPHICTSHIFTSRSSLLSLLRPGAAPPEHHETQPSAEIARIEGAKRRRNCDWSGFIFGGSLARNARFGDLALHFWRISYETLVLETWRHLALHFWRKSRTKPSFWRLGASLLEDLVRNAHFGDLALHLWSWTQTWPVCSA